MNKKLYKYLVLIIGIVLLIPNNVLAAKIASSRIGSIDSATIGKKISVPFYIDLSGVDKTSNSSYGIFMAGFELIFDDDILSIVDIKSTGFDSKVYTENGEYAVISTINNDSTENTCVDNILYCGEYEVVITFIATDTNEESTIIKMGDVAVGGFQLTNGTHSTYKLADMIELEDTANKSRTITINKSDNDTDNLKEKPKSIVSSTKPVVDDLVISNTINEKKEEEISKGDKSSNNYLSNLDVKGYILDFYKRTTDYDLVVEKDTNKLQIEAILEDKKSTLEIIGADDLKKNNYKVKINVKAEDGSIRTYTINVSYEKEKNNKKVSRTEIINKTKDFLNQNKLYLIIGASILFIIILVYAIINKINDKKLGNKFDNF